MRLVLKPEVPFEGSTCARERPNADPAGGPGELLAWVRRLCGYVVDQFSTVNPGTTVRSLSVLTTVVLPRLKAMAAMSRSIFPIGRPVRFSSAAIRPYSSAAASVSGQMISSGSTRRNLSAFLSRLPLFSTPNQSSARTGSPMPIRCPAWMAAVPAHTRCGDGGCNRRHCCRGGNASFPDPA